MTPLIFGEVLFDRFPDGRDVLGGAPFNVAWNLQALGAPPQFISRVGDDEPGRRIRAAMVDWGLDTTALQTDPKHETGVVAVGFTDGEPHYEIMTDRAWDHIEPIPTRSLGDPLLYHGSLALRSSGSRRTLAALREGAGGNVFVDVNLRDPWWDRDTVLGTLQAARWAKLNADELALLAPAGPDLDARSAALLADRELEALIVTLGPDGARVLTAAGERIARPAVARGAVVDTVGAGDAFSAVTLLGLLNGWSWPTILDRAQDLAGAVVGLRGATATDITFYRTIADTWERS